MPLAVLTPILGSVAVGPALPLVVSWQFDPADGPVTAVELRISAINWPQFEVMYYYANAAPTSVEAPMLELGKTYFLEFWAFAGGSWRGPVRGIFGLAPIVEVEVEGDGYTGAAGTGIGALWAAVMPDMMAALGSTSAHPERGETITLVRPSTLVDVVADAAPAAMVVASAASAGATTVVLRLAGSTAIRGKLVAGSRLVIAGQTLTVAADAAAGSTTISVTTTAGLAAGVSVGAAVEVQHTARITLPQCHVSRRIRRDLALALSADLMAVVTIPLSMAPTKPILNDYLELEDGTGGRVAGVVSDTGAFLKVALGA